MKVLTGIVLKARWRPTHPVLTQAAFHMGPSWAPSGPSWPQMGQVGPHLGPTKAPLGPNWGPFGNNAWAPIHPLSPHPPTHPVLTHLPTFKLPTYPSSHHHLPHHLLIHLPIMDLPTLCTTNHYLLTHLLTHSYPPYHSSFNTIICFSRIKHYNVSFKYLIELSKE